jgi:glycosyltransferase involved in cell wall biosynthesis
MPVTFSVVTACRNAASVLPGAIESVLGQTFDGGLEYIVIDGASNDGTLDVIKKYAHGVSRLVSEPDGGIYQAFNKGVKLAGGDVVGILNADDRYAPWALAAVAEATQAHPQGDVFYGKVASVEENQRRWAVYPLGDPRRLTSYMCLPHPAVFVRKRVYDKLGLFDESYRIAGDWDFILRAYLANLASFCPVDRVLTAFVRSGVSSRPSRLLVAENRKIYFKYLGLASAVKNTAAMECRYYGRKLLDACGIYRLYSGLRDGKLLKAEASGFYVNSIEEIWSALR